MMPNKIATLKDKIVDAESWQDTSCIPLTSVNCGESYEPPKCIVDGCRHYELVIIL